MLNIVRECEVQNPLARPGTVYLVGAGPGDPGLITLRAVECLARADLVLYDYLVNPRLLSHAKRGAELVCVGRHGHGRIMSQEEINHRTVEGAQHGRTVVRLKGGDPIVFARIAEETDALDAANIPYEVVPGITAALAAGSYGGIPLTHRGLASAVALVTGHEKEGKSQSAIDYAGLAPFPGTLIFYMGVTTAPQWSEQLIAAGKPADTPVALVRRCSWPDQSIVRCTLAEISATIDTHHIRPPVLFIVGKVASLAPLTSWFSSRPLFGRRILITRPEEQVAGMLNRLSELGAECFSRPAIEIGPPADWTPVDQAIALLEETHWIVFSSANGVRYFIGRLLETGYDLRQLGKSKLAVVGPGTADALAQYHLRADLQPGEYRAESLAEELNAAAAGQRFLLIRASRGREVLADELVRCGGTVTQVVAYRSTDNTCEDTETAATLKSGCIDWVTVTSSAIAGSLVNKFGDSLKQSKLVSISPITSDTLRNLGHMPSAEAKVYTAEGIVQAILEFESAASRST